MLVADRALHGGIVGWTGERCLYCLRVRQGQVDRRRAESRREPQGDGQDVSVRPRMSPTDDCPFCADFVEKVFLARLTKILRATDAFYARRREGPYRFIQNR